ncbi:hypothetical protein JTB14_026967 [Gonioctena quinquepunctata]|nr:hypothetical protein JTB14_026967 [Gonioctena quinquepunctata]
MVQKQLENNPNEVPVVENTIINQPVTSQINDVDMETAKREKSDYSGSKDENESDTQKKTKVSPIILRDKSKWLLLRTHMEKCVPKIGFSPNDMDQS